MPTTERALQSYARGQNDFAIGRKVTANPFPRGRDRAAWTNGWHAARNLDAQPVSA